MEQAEGVTAGEPMRSRRAAIAWVITAEVVVILLASWVVVRQVPIAHFLDVALYVRTGDAILQGAWPYIDFKYEYPLGAAIPMVGIATLSLQSTHFPDVPGVLRFVPYGDQTGPYAVWKQFFYGCAASGVLACICVGSAAALYYRILHRYLAERLAWNGFLRFVGLTVLCVPILIFRFDYFPMFLTVAALYTAVRDRPSWTGLLLGLAVVVKLYPLVLIPLFIGWWLRKRDWRPVATLILAGIIGMVAIYVPYLFKAPTAPLQFLAYHQERGLQIESTWAGIAFIARDLANVHTFVTYDHGANHVQSSVARALLVVQPIVTVLGYVGVLVLYALALNRRHRSPAGVTPAVLLWGFMAVMLMLVLTSKIFSTQFIVWLIPGLAMFRGYRSLLAAAAVVLTFCIFPLDLFMYGMMYPLRSLTLNARNAILVYLLVVTMLQLARLARSDTHEPLGLRH